jgi:Transglycosylase SLT domain
MNPDAPLEPNLVKALIASESGFDPNRLANKKTSNSARGLMQITNDTRKLLGGNHGDLKDHLITVTKTELNDPNTNICAGVRWLFEKRRQASSRLKRPATWIETVWEYKGMKLSKTKKDEERIQAIFNEFYEEFQKCKKS